MDLFEFYNKIAELNITYIGGVITPEERRVGVVCLEEGKKIRGSPNPVGTVGTMVDRGLPIGSLKIILILNCA